MVDPVSALATATAAFNVLKKDFRSEETLSPWQVILAGG